MFLTEEPRDLIGNNIDITIAWAIWTSRIWRCGSCPDAAERILFASPAYLERHGEVDQPEALLRHNCLTWPLDGRFEDGHALWRFRDARGVRELRITGGCR